MKHIFFQWLKDKGIYEMFRDNYIDEKNPLKKPISEPEHYVGGSFWWNETPEKNDFWYEVHQQWLNHLGNLRLQSLLTNQ